MRLAMLCLLVLPVQAAVSGTVVNSASGAPVRKALVTFRTAGAAALTARTDANGRFDLPDLPPGDYAVLLEAQGFSPLNPATTLHVADEAMAGIALRMTPLSVISGRVLDEEGEPAVSATLLAFRYDYTRPSRPLVETNSASTDDRGEYRIFDLKPGRYYVLLVRSNPSGPLPPPNLAANEGYPFRFYPNAFEPGQASPVTLAPGAEAGHIDFELRKTRLFHVTGTALGEGQPVRAVAVAKSCTANLPAYSAPVLADGSFDLAAVQPGTYCLSIQEVRGQRALYAFRVVTVSDRDVEGVALAAYPGVNLTAEVLLDGAPLVPPANIRVNLLPLDVTDLGISKFIQKDGSAVFQDLIPAAYAIGVDALPPDVYVRDIRYGGTDVSGGRIDVQAPAPLSISLARGTGRVQVTVLDASGNPAPGVPVTLAPTGAYSARLDLVRTVSTNSEGSVQFAQAPGDYQVAAWETSEPELVRWPEFRALLMDGAAKVTATAGRVESVRVKAIPAAQVDLLRSRLP